MKYILSSVYVNVNFLYLDHSETSKKTSFLYFRDNADKSFKKGSSRFHEKNPMEIVQKLVFTIVFLCCDKS